MGWEGKWRPYPKKNIFAKNIFRENIFGKNIFRENILGKNIFNLNSWIYFSIKFPKNIFKIRIISTPKFENISKIFWIFNQKAKKDIAQKGLKCI